jgi:MarC family integral membrane protein
MMISPERDIAGAFLLVYAGLFPVVNPLGAAPVFLSLTGGIASAGRNRLALRVAINSFLLLLGSMLCGSYVLEFFGITIPAVRVAGGALVACMGWNLLNGRTSSTHGVSVAGRAAANCERRFLSPDIAADRGARRHFRCPNHRCPSRQQAVHGGFRAGARFCAIWLARAVAHGLRSLSLCIAAGRISR